MRFSSKSIFYIAALLFISNTTQAGDISPIINTVIPYESTAGIKEAMTFQIGDANLTLGANLKTQHLFYNNAAFLNKKVPDQSEFFKQTVDAFANYVYGENKYGHKAIESHIALRNKIKWGTAGVYAESTKTDLKVADIDIGDHKHKSSKTLIWLRTAWLQASLNAIFGIESEKKHFIKIGWYPFALGRGISFGSNYGASKRFLGVYSYAEDKFAPGILFNGEILKDKLSYDIYYSKIEDKSTSVGDSFNLNKINHIYRRNTPWSGPAKDNDLIAGRLKWTALDGDNGKLEIEPYALYNEASDQKIEFEADSKSALGTFGLMTEYKKNKFEIGGEVAVNVGHEKLYAIDRNQVKLKRHDGDPNLVNLDNQGLLRETYTQVTAVNSDAPMTQTNEEKIIQSRYDSDYNLNGLANKDTRFRKQYKNHYCGWFGLIDAAYLFENPKIKVAAAYGYISGDNNPHEVEENKNYKDFIGLNEWYAGKRVRSIFLLGERVIILPLSLTENTKGITIDNTFSNMHHVGMGFTWWPSIAKSKKFKITPNSLFFWRSNNSLKYNSSEEKLSDGIMKNTKASRYIGTEFNISIEVEPIKDLLFYAVAAAFVPGGFYKDIKALPIYPDIYGKLDAVTKANVNMADYRLNTDTAFFLDLGIKFSF